MSLRKRTWNLIWKRVASRLKKHKQTLISPKTYKRVIMQEVDWALDRIKMQPLEILPGVFDKGRHVTPTSEGDV